MAHQGGRRRIALAPECVPLEQRQVLSLGATSMSFPAVQQLGALPAFRDDAQSTHDMQTLDGQLRTIAKVLVHNEPAMRRVLHDSEAVIKALTAPGVNSPQLEQLRTAPQFHSVELDNPADESAFRSLLIGLNVPEPLVDRYLADRQKFIHGLGGMAAEGDAIDASLKQLLADGVRTGAIRPGDVIYTGMVAQIADFQQQPLRVGYSS